MFKKSYVLATASFLAIPAVSVLGPMLINSIDPEIAAGHANYEHNYRLLSLVKDLSLLAVSLVTMGLWFLTCFFWSSPRNDRMGGCPWPCLARLD
jgi:hypothetical protein